MYTRLNLHWDMRMKIIRSGIKSGINPLTPFRCFFPARDKHQAGERSYHYHCVVLGRPRSRRFLPAVAMVVIRQSRLTGRMERCMVRPNLARTVSHWAIETRYSNPLDCGKSFAEPGDALIQRVAFQRHYDILLASNTPDHGSLMI